MFHMLEGVSNLESLESLNLHVAEGEEMHESVAAEACLDIAGLKIPARQEDKCERLVKQDPT